MRLFLCLIKYASLNIFLYLMQNKNIQHTIKHTDNDGNLKQHIVAKTSIE